MLLLFSSVVAAGLVSLALGKDTSWDLLNYHFYNPYAFLQGRLEWDIAPAQLQTYLNPLPDLLFYFLLENLPSPAWVGFVMGCVHGLAVYLLIEIAWIVLGVRTTSWPWVLPAVAVGVGATGAAALPLIGGTSNDWIVAIFVLLGLLVALRTCVREDGSQRLWGLLVAGSAVGIAAGVKPAAVPYALALVVAVFVARAGRRGLVAAAVVGGAAVAGMVLSGGYTMWQLGSTFGNPLFPFFNDIFRSEYWEPRRFRLDFFKPRDLVQWAFYPFYWLRTNQGVVTELPMRDGRFAVVMSLLLVGAVRRLGALRTSRSAAGSPPEAPVIMRRLLLTFFVVSYLTWLYLFSILRYLAALELLTGVVVAVLLLPSAGPPSSRRVVAVIAVALVLVVTTVHPNWGRARFGSRYFELDPPDLPARSLVLLVGWAPMSFLIPLVREDARFVGLENNILRPGQRHGLYRLARETVRNHEGPLFFVNATQERDRAVAVLADHGLERAGASCVLLPSPLGTPLELCPLSPPGATGGSSRIRVRER